MPGMATLLFGMRDIHMAKRTQMFLNSLHVISKGVGMGAAKRSWGGSKRIKDGQRVHLSGKKVE